MIHIGGRPIGPDQRPYIVAELSANHNGSLERALGLVEAAAAAGADAVKLQTYTADTMTLDVAGPEFRIEDPASLWHGRSLHDLYAEAATPYAWHEPIFALCRTRGIAAFSTPFDESAVEFLETLAPPAYKIASFELTDTPLIARVARTGKPLIVSTGMGTLDEIEDAVRTARENGASQIVLLKCTSTYPADARNSNLATIPHLRATFGTEAGLSDHTLGIGAAVAAIAFGAVFIEKHLTLRRADGGPDSAFSLEPGELRMLVDESERAWQARGEVRYGPLPAEAGSRQFRRSLYVAEDMQAGEVFTPRNLRIVRPGYGLAPKHYADVLGKRVRAAAKKGTAVDWDLVVG